MPLSSELTLEATTRSASEARRWVSDVCRQLERPDLIECAEIGVSELVANAVIHAIEPYAVRVRGTKSHPRIEVVDGSTAPPVPYQAPDTDDLDLLLTFGRGLAMVSQCAVAWGASIGSRSKVVWFEPAATMHENDMLQLDVDRHEAPSAEPVSEDAIQIRLLNVDVRLHSSVVRQYAELRRELRLLSLSHEADYPLAADLSAMFTTFERQFPEAFIAQVAAAQERHQTHVDLVFPMLPESGPIFVTMTEMFEVADAFCSAERLLALARTPLQREFDLWMLDEVIAQLVGATPRAWRGSRLESEQASSIRVG